jgi:hypothetical protein
MKGGINMGKSLEVKNKKIYYDKLTKMECELLDLAHKAAELGKDDWDDNLLSLWSKVGQVTRIFELTEDEEDLLELEDGRLEAVQ